MNIEKKRLFKILSYLVQNGGVSTSKEIANYLGMSERTVKNDLIEVKDLAIASGCILHSKKGSGYWIEIVDRVRFQEVETNLYLRFSDVNYTREYEDRANVVTRMLLISNEYIKIDDIAETLYLSKNSVKSIMKEVKLILDDFGLALITKPHYGSKIEGLEINRRFCMLELFLDHDIRALPLIDQDDYVKYFQFNDIDLMEFRQIMLENLRKSSIRIIDNNTHKLLRYLILMFHRYQENHIVNIEEKDKQILVKMPEYVTAKGLLKKLKEKFPLLIYDENEIYSLELLLLLWHDFKEDDNFKQEYELFYIKADEIVDQLLNDLGEKYNLLFQEIPNIKAALISGIIPNLTKYYFPFINYHRTIGKKVENNQMFSSPVCIRLAMDIAEILWKNYQVKYSTSDIVNISVRLYSCIRRITYNYTPRKIIISAQSGVQSCVIIRDKILHKFDNSYFNVIELMNSYEIRNLRESDYDYIISNFAPRYYRFHLPFIYVDTIPNEMQLNQIYRQVILGGYHLRELQEELDFDKNFVYDHFCFTNRKDFLQLCAYKYCEDANKTRSFLQELQQFSDICIWNDILFLINDQRYTNKNYMDIYRLDKADIWEKKKIKIIVFMSLDLYQNIKLLKYCEQLTHELISNKDQIDDLVATKSMNQFTSIIKNALLAE